MIHDPERPGRFVGFVMINGRKVKRRAGTEAEVHRKLDDLLDAVDRGVPLDGLSMTVDQMVDGYLSSRTDDPRATREKYAYFGRHVTHLWSGRVARTLTAGDVEDGLRRKLGTGLAVDTVRRIRQLLDQSYRWAARHRLLDVNPAAATEPPGDGVQTSDARPLHPDDAGPYLAAARPHRLAVVAFLMVHAGLRVQEVRGLLWEDVILDHDPPVIAVTGQADRWGTRTHVKSTRSRRVVAVGPDLLEVLLEHRARQRSERTRAARSNVAWPDGTPEGDRLVVLSDRGTAVSANRLNRLAHQWATEAGLDRPVRTKDGRSTFGTIAIAGGKSLFDVAAMMGNQQRVAEHHYVRHLDNVHDATVVGTVLAQTRKRTRRGAA